LLELSRQGPELLPKGPILQTVSRPARPCCGRDAAAAGTLYRVSGPVKPTTSQLGLPAAADCSSKRERLAVDGVTGRPGVTANSPFHHPAAAIDLRLAACSAPPELQLPGFTRVCFVERGPGPRGGCRWGSLAGTAQVASSTRISWQATCCDRSRLSRLKPFYWRVSARMIALGGWRGSLTGLGVVPWPVRRLPHPPTHATCHVCRAAPPAACGSGLSADLSPPVRARPPS